MRSTDTLGALTAAIEHGRRDEAVAHMRAAVAAGEPPRKMLDALAAGMADVGRRFSNEQAFIPEVLTAARAMKRSMAVLEPVLVDAGIRPEFTAVIGTVQGDLHDIGKNLVAMMWKGSNYAVVDLGTNVSPETFIEAAGDYRADVIGMSSLMTTTLPAMQRTVRALRCAGLKARVIVGGAPVTGSFARRIGADGYARDAATVVRETRRLMAAG